MKVAVLIDSYPPQVPEGFRALVIPPSEAQVRKFRAPGVPVDLLWIGAIPDARAVLELWLPDVAVDGGVVVLPSGFGPPPPSARVWLPYRQHETMQAFISVGCTLGGRTTGTVPSGYAMDDPFLRTRLAEIVHAFGITTIVETGVNEGLSTVAFARIPGVHTVYGIDNDQRCLDATRQRASNAGVSERIVLVWGSSPAVLRQILPQLDVDRTIFFLDAHWGAYWPLLDEIAEIPRGRGVIVVHDMKVPGRDFGYDSYDGADLDYEYVRAVLAAWSPAHRIEYNEEATNSRRGVGYVFPT